MESNLRRVGRPSKGRWALVAGWALAGCTSSAIPTQDMRAPAKVVDSALLAANPARGALVVKRDGGGPLGQRGCTHYIAIDGRPALELGHEQGATVYLAPGEHIVRLTFQPYNVLCNTGESQVAVNIVIGEQKTIRSVVNAGGIVNLQQAAN